MRMTRAQMRAQAQEKEMREQQKDLFIHEDISETDSPAMSSSSEDSTRPALRDITDDNYPQPDFDIHAEIEQSTTKTRHKAKSRSTKKKVECVSDTPPEMAELVKQSLSEAQGAELVEQEAEQEQILVATPEQLETEVAATQTPTEPTTESFLSKTPKFNPDIHMATETITQLNNEDSFLDSITSRSPSKLSEDSTEQSVPRSNPFFAGKNPRKSPRRSSRRVSVRIEDSVEAMDALEDAIEKLTEDLPVLSPKHTAVDEKPKTAYRNSPKVATPSIKQNTSAVRTPRTTSMTRPAASPLPKSTVKGETKTPVAAALKVSSTVVPKKASPVKSVNPVKIQKPSPVTSSRSVTTSRPTMTTGKPQSSTLKTRPKTVSRLTTSTRISTVSKPQEATSRTGMSLSSTPAKQQQNAVKKRVTSSGTLSTSKPGFVPTKSNKPPTTSNFSLPGDAIAAKLKAQREERLKREEEAAQNRPKQFKARPAPNMSARPSTMPRENKASKARLSMMTNGSDKENVSPRPSNTKPSVTVKKARVGLNAVDSKANSSVRRTTQAGPASANKPSGPPSARITSLSSGQRSTVTKEDSANQKVKGKEVFGRIKASIDQQQKERREKEEAARKARAEAAERGRQASREWAEKHKKKLAEAAALKASAVTTAT